MNEIRLMRFGWLFRSPLLWGTFAWCLIMSAGVVFGIAIVTMPDKWDRAIAIKVCSGLPVVQREDGTIWLRDRWRSYRVEDPGKLC
jgi:hypothetical protein